MKAKRTTKGKRTIKKSDWRRVDAQTDDDIRRAIRKDSDAAPEVDAAWFKSARVVMPQPKQAVSLRLDREVMEWFKKQGRGYQTRINAVLRAYVNSQR
ncbi:MAG: BrnA antitoxin family protein [Bryobacteraceae bacterium]